MTAKLNTNPALNSGGQMAAHDAPDTLINAVLFFFTHRTPVVFGLAALLAIILRLQISNFNGVDLLIVAVLMSGWPFWEWYVHKKVLHRHPDKFKSAYLAKWAGDHRGHHAEPWKYELIFLEPKVLLSIPVVAVASYFLLPLQHALTLCAVAFYTSVQYEWVHYIVHTRVEPKTLIGRWILKHHRMHHFRNERYWYAFSIPWVDGLLGTGPSYKDAPVSSKTRTLD